ncbi:MAG: uroporphyrinogen-III synthase [Bacteroidetes bacterium]|nr:uroporphyrinogen-III synthase [Bacteroidota bacterium]
MRIKNILISQPEPLDKKSPFTDLADKYNVKITFKKFIRVDQVPAMEFLKERIHILDHSAIIMTSRTAIENFFRICKETRVEVPANMKFFCISEAFALYLQKFTTYRKRKIFFPKTKDKSIKDIILKHREEKFFFPCSNISNSDIPEFMEKENIPYTTGILYKTVSEDLNDIEISGFDIISFFSPAGITSLHENFPNFEQRDIKIASFGENTAKAVTDSGLTLSIEAPTPQAPSMKMALEQFIKNFNK